MMTYDEMRAKANDGDVIFLTVDKTSWMSRLTSWVTRSPFTHTTFVFWYMNRLMVVESTTTGGSRIVQASTYQNRLFDIVPAPVPWKDIADQALSRSGTANYGWGSAIYIGLRETLFLYFDIKLPMDKNNRNKACSEFIAEILEFPDVDISPKTLYQILTKENIK